MKPNVTKPARSSPAARSSSSSARTASISSSGPEQQRDPVQVQRAVALTEASCCEGAALQLADANLPQHLRVVAHDAAGVELEHHAAAGALVDLLGPGAHLLHPARAVGRDGRDLDVDGVRRTCGEREHRGEQQPCRPPRAVCCPAVSHQKYSFELASRVCASCFANTLNSVNSGASTGASNTSVSKRSCSS